MRRFDSGILGQGKSRGRSRRSGQQLDRSDPSGLMLLWWCRCYCSPAEIPIYRHEIAALDNGFRGGGRPRYRGAKWPSNQPIKQTLYAWPKTSNWKSRLAAISIGTPLQRTARCRVDAILGIYAAYGSAGNSEPYAHLKQ